MGKMGGIKDVSGTSAGPREHQCFLSQNGYGYAESVRYLWIVVIINNPKAHTGFGGVLDIDRRRAAVGGVFMLDCTREARRTGP